MRQGLKLVVLAGSAEARAIAAGCRVLGADVRALVSEPPRGANPMPVRCDLQDFTALPKVTRILRGCDAIVDASHGFDALMSTQGHAAARHLDIPLISYQRPQWPVDTPHTIAVRDVRAAMAHIGAGARVFSAAGWASLPDCRGFKGATLFLRQTSPHDRAVPFPFVTLNFGTPPFDVAREVALFDELAIDTLLCRNLGGDASFAKVAAAQRLGLKTILIARPPLPDGAAVVDRVEAAIDWVATL